MFTPIKDSTDYIYVRQLFRSVLLQIKYLIRIFYL